MRAFRRLASLAALLWMLEPGAAPAIDFADAHPVPPGHLRVMTWNLEVFNLRNTHPQHTGTPYGPRTSAQLDDLASRILGFDAAVIALQEMNDLADLADLRDRLNGGTGATGPWRTVTQASQQNALLYDDSRVDLLSSAFSLGHAGVLYPEEWSYRAPVTSLFAPEGEPDTEFRVIGIHASWQGPAIREQQGAWLSVYLTDFIDAPGGPHAVLLVGDMNGTPVAGDDPHDGIVAAGDMTYVPKSNGESTAIGGATIDHVYASDEALARLTDPTSFVIRNDFYGETTDQFRETYSDHFPVFVDLAVALPAAVPGVGVPAALALVACLIGLGAARLRTR